MASYFFVDKSNILILLEAYQLWDQVTKVTSLIGEVWLVPIHIQISGYEAVVAEVEDIVEDF